MNAHSIFERIESAYSRLGYNLNWGFLTCPESKFVDPEVLLVGLNPGGGRGSENDPTWERQKVYSQEAGNAYLVETWDDIDSEIGAGKAPLQLQVQGLCKFVKTEIADLASANFVPFQSPSWNELPRHGDALDFARELWGELVSDIKPKLVIGLGIQVGNELARLFGVDHMNAINSGWGNIKLRYGDTRYGGRLVVLPHLSRYKLFNADGSDNRYSPALKIAFGLGSGTNA